MLNNLTSRSLLFVAMLCAPWAPVAAQDEAQAKGLQIAKEQKMRDRGWGDSESELQMTLRNAQGRESVRRMRALALEVQGDGDKSLTIFDEPMDVRGSAFLTHAHPTAEDEQWLYLPSVKRTRRIASRNKSGPFMASEFAYEDMTSFELEKFSFRYLRDEACAEQLQCFVVEQTPTDSFSGYSKILVWVDTEHYRVQRAEYYDRKDSLLKTLTTYDYQLYLDKFWRPHRLVMENQQTGKSTELLLESMRFQTGRTAADFDVSALERAR
ncbi:outer membrane lipoprotein-sorting protein [Rheinheimera sp. UJ63]|uniref:outer membrane lipoprotein-sorting protein n=1 Tax=Rheinheimera sp. UJ63 TaxID=2910157 RepID=UPI001F2BA387|nr:outer membrane lipoprotein-sorting protein [Rheinheimera sp. UJ63]MCF4008720.1 outer membrane lipoprotein-sorting protein [Rheinheimera sp. UJ63]